MFLMSQPQVNLWKRLLQNILEECLKKMNYLPARDNKKLNKLIEQMNTAAVIIDATERAIQRPIDNDVQEEYYSGKKKMHSVKNTVIRAFESNYILYLGGTFEGKAHDKTILEAEEIHFSKNINGYFDLAYLKLIIKNLKLILPHKKPKGKELTEQQKQENKEMSQIRVGVEHSIGALKRLHILKHKLRVKKKYQYDQLIFLGCGIHNYRVIKRVKSIIN
jgi:hypothetical protein